MQSHANKLFSRAGIPNQAVVGAGLMRTVLECNARKLQNLKLDFIQIDQETEESTSVTLRRKIRLGDWEAEFWLVRKDEKTARELRCDVYIWSWLLRVM